jgi:hypothetical protein
MIQRTDPSNPRALPLVVDQLSAATKTPGVPTAEMVPLLRRSLERSPLNPRAIRQIAAFEDARGRKDASRALLAVGGRTGRRDPMLNVLLAKNAALDNQAPALVRHLDAALSTFRGGDAQVFPLLVKPLADPRFRAEVKAYMDRPWSEPFMLYAAQNADPRDVLALALTAPHLQTDPKFERFRGELVSSLVRRGAADRAIAYARRIAPDPAALARGGISGATTDPRFAPVTWRLSNQGGLYVSAQGTGLIVSTDPAARGQALERVMALAPGRYRLTASRAMPATSDPVIETWSATCLRGTAEQGIARREGPAQSGPLALPFVVPQGCDGVRLALDIVNRSDQNPAEYEIRDLRLTREQG